jgi:lambda family phage holin
MADMPEKPDTWSALLAWVNQHSHVLYAAALSGAVGALRIIYGGGARRQVVLEACLCALITAGAFPLLEYFDLPQNMAAALGAFVGALGMKKIATLADRFADLKLPKRDSNP